MANKVSVPNSNQSMSIVCFLVYLLLEGLQRVSGVLFLAIRDCLRTDRRAAAIPFALCRATENIIGTSLHLVKNREKSGVWIQWGCFLAAAGIATCFLTTQIVWLSVFWGILFGAGIGLASPLLAAELRKRENISTISSLYPASPSFGCILLPFLLNVLVNCYGLSGCYVILAGIVLNCIPLIMVARYQIRFHLPKVRWRFRMKGTQYEVSEIKPRGNDTAIYRSGKVKEFMNESFSQNLEPDILQNISNNKQSVPDISKEYLNILQPIIEAKLKMVTEQANDRETFNGLQNPHPYSVKSEFPEVKSSDSIDNTDNYENNHTAYETSSCHQVLESEDSENFAQPTIISTNNNNTSLEQNMTTDILNDCIKEKDELYSLRHFATENLKNKHLTKKKEKEAMFLDEDEEKDSNECFAFSAAKENDSNENNKEYCPNCLENNIDENNLLPKTMIDSLEEKSSNKSLEINKETLLFTETANINNEKECESVNSIPETTEMVRKIEIMNDLSSVKNSLLKTAIISNAKKFPIEPIEKNGTNLLHGITRKTEWRQSEKAMNSNQQFEKPPLIATSNSNLHIRKKTVVGTSRRNSPLEIKVHVVECTISTNEDCLGFMISNETVSKKGYRRHSNSLISDCYKDIDFSKLILNNKSSGFHENQANLNSRMCLISEEDEYDSCSFNAASDVEAHHNNDPATNKGQIAKTLGVLSKPSCLAIIYANVTYEFTLAVLLTIFADLAKDTGDVTLHPNIVLVAFGLGGIVGQMSFKYCRSRLLADGSHAAAAVIFMLNALASAGILWSANISWLSGFYATLGFVERGIIFTIPEVTSDYTDAKTRQILSAVSKYLSAVAVLCIPCSIGFSRDDTDDYDGLLQVTSCLSVLCAVLCYFLPKMTTTRKKSTSGKQNK